MFGSVLLWTLTLAKLSVADTPTTTPKQLYKAHDFEKDAEEEKRKEAEAEDKFKEKHEKMKEMLKNQQDREKDRERMFREKEDTQKQRNQMFETREDALDKMLDQKEKLIDKKEHDFERQTAEMEREDQDQGSDSDSSDSSDSDADDSSFLETGSRWNSGSDERRAEKKFERMSAAVARKQANTAEELKHLQYELDRTPSSFAQVGELPTFPKPFAKLAEDTKLQNDDEAVQDDEKNVDEKYEELQNTLKQMSPEKAVAEDEARAELDEDEPSSFLQTSDAAPRAPGKDYGRAYLELLAKGGVKNHYAKKAAAAGALARKLAAVADTDESASKAAFLQLMKDNKAKFDVDMKGDLADAKSESSQWDKLMEKKRTEAAAQRLASSFMEEAAAGSGDDDEDEEMKKVEDKALESAEDIEDIDKKIKAREAAEAKGERLLDAEIKEHEAKAAKILQSQPDLIGNIEKNLRDDSDSK